MQEYALITGASGGIGMELAKLMAADQYNLILVARNKDKLAALKDELEKKFDIKVIPLVKDLTEPDSPKSIYNEVEKLTIRPSVLVNNAGFGLFGAFISTNWEKEEEMIHLNIRALTQLTKLFLPMMLAEGKGKILNVSSVAGFMPGPLMSVYYATKAYVNSFSSALRCELKGTGVYVTNLCPGPTKTGFEGAAGLEESGLFKRLPLASAKSVAQYGYKKMKKKRGLAVHGMLNKLTLIFVRLLPTHWLSASVKKMQGNV